MEIDHIVQRADGGQNAMENAIALCFDCHAEAHAYNPRHPVVGASPQQNCEAIVSSGYSSVGSTLRRSSDDRKMPT
jgi:hypothetical protein